MKLFLLDLVSHTEEERTYSVTLDRPALFGHTVLDSEIRSFAVGVGKDRRIELKASGSVRLSYLCDRCLRKTDVTVSFEDSMIVDPERSEDEHQDPVYFITDHSLDTDDFLSELIRPYLPMRVLCTPDCKGICPNCGANLNESRCTCDMDSKKTRMAEALQAAFKEADSGFTID